MVIICQRCKGCGQVEFDAGTHKSEYVQEKCIKCNGSGRMVRKTVTVDTPFVPGKEIERIF